MNMVEFWVYIPTIEGVRSSRDGPRSRSPSGVFLSKVEVRWLPGWAR